MANLSRPPPGGHHLCNLISIFLTSLLKSLLPLKGQEARFCGATLLSQPNTLELTISIRYGVKPPDSVHLADFPVADITKIDEQLAADTRLAMKISSLGRAARSQAGIKVRQPLAHVVVSVASSKEQESLEQLKPQILEELNVKDLKIESLPEVVKLDGHGYVVSGLELDKKKGIKVPIRGGVYYVVVPTVIPPELAMEGMAREVVHRLQIMRRSAGFDIADYIHTYYDGDDYMKQVMSDFADYIKQETLSRQLIEGVPEQDIYAESHRLGGYDILLGVKRLG